MATLAGWVLVRFPIGDVECFLFILVDTGVIWIRWVMLGRGVEDVMLGWGGSLAWGVFFCLEY